MADLYASIAPVRLNDGTADANNAKITNAAPSSTDYALATRQIGFPAAAALADATANPTLTGIASYLFGWNGTTWDRLKATTANGLAVDVTRVTGTVTVDSELAAAAALADGAANPTTPMVGSDNLLYNGTTWDRQRSIVAALDSTGIGLAGAAIVGQLDDTATAAVTENQFAPIRISTRRALLVEGVASGTAMPVSIAATVTVDTELAAAAAQADAVANPTIPNVGAFMSLFNGTTWDRLRGDTTNGIDVDVTRVQGTVTVDSELPAAAALADAVANPTVPAVGAYLVGFNGTTWDRIRTANTGRLQVDVVTGGSSLPANELPTSTNLISLYGTSAAVAGGATQTAVVTNTPANTKHLYVRWAYVTASGQTKWQVKFGATVLHTEFNTQQKLSEWVRFDPPLDVTGDGSTALTIDVTNREASAMDVYAALRGAVQQ